MKLDGKKKVKSKTKQTNSTSKTKKFSMTFPFATLRDNERLALCRVIIYTAWFLLLMQLCNKPFKYSFAIIPEIVISGS